MSRMQAVLAAMSLALVLIYASMNPKAGMMSVGIILILLSYLLIIELVVA